MKATVDFNDMLQTLRMVKKMGPMKNLLKMIPGLATTIPEAAFDAINDKDIGRIQAIILSMTPAERSTPRLISYSRQRRIAAGSGTSVDEVNNLVQDVLRKSRPFDWTFGGK